MKLINSKFYLEILIPTNYIIRTNFIFGTKLFRIYYVINKQEIVLYQKAS